MERKTKTVFPGQQINYTFEGMEKAGTVAVVGAELHLVHADGGGDDLIDSKDVR